MRLLGSALVSVLLVGCSASPEPENERKTIKLDIGRSTQAGDRRGSEPPAAEPRPPPPDVPGAAGCDGARDPTTTRNERAAEIAIRCLTNAARREHGRAELRFNERLARAAATRSNDMVRLGYFSHNGPEGGNVRRAVERNGWIPENRSWLLGENIGWAPQGQATPARLMREWLDSPTHRANIMSRDFTQLGVGAIAAVPGEQADPGATYTQVFGVRGRQAREAQMP